MQGADEKSGSFMADGDAVVELDDWSDPEARLLRLEAEEIEEEEEARKAAPLGIFERLDELLVDYSPQERRLFWLVFVDGVSIAAAGREAGVQGNVHVKFKKMLGTVGHLLGDLMP